MTGTPFDVDAFLARPLVARVATNGPTVRPVWYLWEDRAFWVLTGPWTKLFTRVRTDPRLALIVDECDVATGVVRQVVARGRGCCASGRCDGTGTSHFSHTGSCPVAAGVGRPEN